MLNFLFSMALLFYFCFCFAKSTLVKKDQHLIKLKGNIKTQCLKTSLKSPKRVQNVFFSRWRNKRTLFSSHAFIVPLLRQRCYKSTLFGARALLRERFFTRTLFYAHAFFTRTLLGAHSLINLTDFTLSARLF